MDDFAILYLKIESSYTNISQPVRVSADRKMSNISNNTNKKGRKEESWSSRTPWSYWSSSSFPLSTSFLAPKPPEIASRHGVLKLAAFAIDYTL